MLFSFLVKGDKDGNKKKGQPRKGFRERRKPKRRWNVYVPLDGLDQEASNHISAYIE